MAGIFQKLRYSLTRGVLQGTDRDSLQHIVIEGSSLHGTNFWMLGFSAVIACIGLDTGSTAVIIGAMLISPLMGPILGCGFSLAVHDRPLLRVSLSHFLQAVLVTLGISTLYFLVTPLGEPTSELLARTRPNLLDAAVAFFGGAAGILAQSRKSPSSAIPGVAIATALMPPLCTVGSGLAALNGRMMLGASYLFLLNAAFIALATYLVVRLLRFPVMRVVNPREHRRRELQFALLFLLLLLPGTFFLYREWDRLHWQRAARTAVQQALTDRGCDVVSWKLETGFRGAKFLRVYAASDSMPVHWQRLLDSTVRGKGMPFDSSRIVCLGEHPANLAELIENRDGAMAEIATYAIRRELARSRQEDGDRVRTAAAELAALWPGVHLTGAGTFRDSSGVEHFAAGISLDSGVALDSAQTVALKTFLRLRLKREDAPALLVRTAAERGKSEYGTSYCFPPAARKNVPFHPNFR